MKPVTPQTLYDFRFVSEPSFSPDGRLTAFMVRYADETANAYRGDLWLRDHETGAVRQLTDGGDAKSWLWTSAGTLLFACCRDPETKSKAEAGEPLTAFYEIDPRGGEAHKAFVVPALVERLHELEDGRFLCLYTWDQRFDALNALTGEARAKALKELTDPAYYTLEDYPFWLNGAHIISGKRGRLGLFDKAAGTLQPLTAPDFDCHAFDEKDGVIVYAGAPLRNRNDGPDGVYRCAVMGGPPACLLAPNTLDVTLLGLWGGRALLALSDGKMPLPDGSGECYGRDQYADFYTIDLAGGELRRLAPYEASIGYGTVGSDARLGGGRGAKADGEYFYFLTTVGDSTVLRRVDRAGNISPDLTPAGSCDSFDVLDGQLVYCGLYGRRLAELYDGAGVRLTRFSNLESYACPEPEPHTFTDRGGYAIHGWAMRPVGWRPGVRYPAILHIHGGPRTVFGPVFHHEMAVWANAGYFVFYCNPRGSDGRGNEFGFISGRYGSVDYEDLMAFTDEMLAKYPEVDPARVGVTGGSYGGFMTNWIIGHTDRFAAAVSQRSIANWTTFEYTTDIGLSFVESQMRTTTDDDAAALWAHSPLRYAKNCKTPTLFIHADNDFRCWMSEGLAMFTALKKAGVPTKLCLFRGENHDLSRSGKPQNRVARMREILAWMDAWCKDPPEAGEGEA